MLRSFGVLAVRRNHAGVVSKALPRHCACGGPLSSARPPCEAGERSSPMALNGRSFGASSQRNKRKKTPPAKQGARKRRDRQRKERGRKEHPAAEVCKEMNPRQEEKLKRQRNLHPAAKMKRVLSATDFWFSARANLMRDDFLREQLYAHRGYVPFATLLGFRRFRHWTDPQLLLETFTSTEGRKRYEVIFDPRLIQLGHEDLERRARQRKENAKRKEARDKERERERYEAAFERARKKLLGDINVEVLQKREAEETTRRAEYARRQYSLRGMLERNRQTWGATSVIAAWDSLERRMRDHNEGDGVKELTLEDIDASYFDVLHDMVLNDDEYYELSMPPWDEEEEHRDDEYDDKESNIMNEDASIASDYKPVDSGGGGDNIQHALVRHRRVTLASVDRLREEEAAMENLRMQIDMEHHGLEGVTGIAGAYKDGVEEWGERDVRTAKEKKKDKPKRLPNYETRREVILVRDGKTLAGFCEMLTKSVQEAATMNEHRTGAPASAVGFDVEYCSLESDIRATLPAMLQLAGPTPNSPVGLIWLHRFPDHGRNMLGKAEYEPLLNILFDSSILKVGVGASKDAKHLASWWGINDAAYMSYYFNGIVDLEEEDSALFGRSLSDMCETVLERRLAKLKQKLSKKDKKRKRQGKRSPTAHWRIDSITKQMKEYAANDASCGVDIWMQLNRN